MHQDDLATLASGSISMPITPIFITPAEMADVAEDELFADRDEAIDATLPVGEDAPISENNAAAIPVELGAWLTRLSALTDGKFSGSMIETALLPATFSVASYRASLLPLLGDENESVLQGATASIARLPLVFMADKPF